MLAKSIVHFAVMGLKAQKANDIVLMDLHQMPNIFTNTMLICSANSHTHVDAIAEHVREEMTKKEGMNLYSMEGMTKKEWILLDYVDLVIHIFLKEERQRYALESYWGDAIIKQIKN